MDIFQKMKYEFNTTSQTGSAIGKPWHLSFVRPFEWTEPDVMQFCQETIDVEIDGKDYHVFMEYAVLTIERPWFHTNLFYLPFRHLHFDGGKISDGLGNGFLPAVNIGMVVTRKIEIEGYYENSNYQVVGWIVKKLPQCP